MIRFERPDGTYVYINAEKIQQFYEQGVGSIIILDHSAQDKVLVKASPEAIFQLIKGLKHQH